FVADKNKVIGRAVQQRCQHIARRGRTEVGHHLFLLGAGGNGNLGLRLALHFEQHLREGGFLGADAQHPVFKSHGHERRRRRGADGGKRRRRRICNCGRNSGGRGVRTRGKRCILKSCGGGSRHSGSLAASGGGPTPLSLTQL